MSKFTSSALVLDDKDKTHLYMWGNNSCVQQGNKDTSDIATTTPTKVQFFEPLIKKRATITQISMSDWTSSAVVHGSDNKDHLYMWANNKYGQQGNGKVSKIVDVNTPTEVRFKGIKVTTITQISMSKTTSSALLKDNNGKTHLYMWGYNAYGQQGNGKFNIFNPITTPTEISFDKNVKSITQISMSNSVSSAVVHFSDSKDHLYMWGFDGFYGQGQGDTKYNKVTIPTEVMFKGIKVTTITQISMSNQTSSALVRDDKGKTHLYMWGSNDYSQQGNRSYHVKTPTEVKFNKKVKKITKISISEYTSSAVVLDDKGKTHLYMWAKNDYGQQGDGAYKKVTTPTEVKFFETLNNGWKITQISMSNQTSSALVKDNNGKTRLYMWGDNRYGQQGNKNFGPDTSDVTTPTKVLELLTTHNNRNYVWIYCVSIGIPIFILILFGIYKFKNPSKNKPKPSTKKPVIKTKQTTKKTKS